MLFGEVFWSDQTKTEPYGDNDKRYVWRSKCEAFKPKNTVLTVKRGGSIMFWACFDTNGIAKSRWNHNYSTLHQQVDGRNLDTTGFSNKTTISTLNIRLLEQFSQKLISTLLQNLWTVLKSQETNQFKLTQFCQEECPNIKPELCYEFVDGY